MMVPQTVFTVVLADGDEFRREGLASILSSQEGYKVIAGVSNGPDALQCIRDLRPALAIINLELSAMHSVELIRAVRSEGIETRIVTVGGIQNEDVAREVFQSGGQGYILTGGPATELIDAIRCVREGGQYLSRSMREKAPAASSIVQQPAARNPFFDCSPEPAPRKKQQRGLRMAIWATGASLLALALIWVVKELAAARPSVKKEVPVAASAPSPLFRAQDLLDRQKYAEAEQLFRQISTAEPGNEAAVKGLASALYRQDKIEEAALALDRLK